MSRYREHYADTFANFNLEKGYDVSETKLSHISEAISTAVKFEQTRLEIAIKLLHHAFKGRLPFSVNECFGSLTDTRTRKGRAMRRQVADAFKEMWFAEWECEATKARDDLMLEGMAEPYAKL